MELDCWDGKGQDEGTIIITHGKAMCTNVYFTVSLRYISQFLGLDLSMRTISTMYTYLSNLRTYIILFLVYIGLRVGSFMLCYIPCGIFKAIGQYLDEIELF